MRVWRRGRTDRIKFIGNDANKIGVERFMRKLVETCENSLVRPRDHGIDQFAALDKIVQRGVQLVQILTRHTITGDAGRGLRGRRLCHRRFGGGDAVDRTIGRINARDRRAGHGRLDPLGRVVMPITKITSNERGKATAQPTDLVLRDIVGPGDLFDDLFFVVFYSAMWWLRGSVLPNDLDEFLTLLAQDALYAANGIALAVEQVANTTQQVDVVRAIIAPTASTLHWFDFVKAAFPKAQHVLRQIEIVGHFTDGAKCVRRLVVQSKPLLSLILTRIRNQGTTA
jgi:hypothetical protein